ncbi:MAG: histidine kinase [Clostridia bacterium]|nr:histidine kinase [Clostridia bacterium]
MPTESIFTTILRRVLWTTLVPLGFLILVISFSICYFVKNDENVRVEKETEQYVLIAKERIDESLSVVESIQSYSYILNNLQNQFENAYEVFDFVSQTNTYMDNITGTLDDATITIYYTNDSLYDSKYFSSSKEFEQYEEILEKINVEEKNFIWENGLHEDKEGNKQVVFYKKFPLSSCDVLECVINLPQTSDDIHILDANDVISNEEQYIVRSINENIKACGIINHQELYFKYMIIVILALVCMLALFILIYFVAFRVLKKTTYNITNFIEHLDVNSLSELDVIAKEQENIVSKELFTVSKTISMLCDEVKNIENVKKNIEIELEQRKISYHTVYNALSAIRIKSYENGEKEITEIVDGLVEYYRMVLNKGENMTFLSDEILMLEKYALVSSLSNYEAYNFSAEIPFDLKFCRIPHMIILPFIENSINHGLSGVDYEGVITVRCQKDKEYLQIKVSDNGVGIPDEKLEKLNNIELFSIGYGIKNVHARLKLLYGEDSTIVFESQEGKGTTVTIRFRAFDGTQDQMDIE